jgi:hypothetical protein
LYAVLQRRSIMRKLAQRLVALAATATLVHGPLT